MRQKLVSWINKESLTVVGPLFLVAIFAFWVAYQFVEPAPPDHIVMSTGGADGAYYLFGQKYREVLARDSITIEVLTSAGSVENIERLEAKAEGVEIAFVQGGTSHSKGKQNLVSLGSLYYEPLWVFYRGRQQVRRLTDLSGKRMATGVQGSGTHSVSLRLLEENGLSHSPTVLSSLGGQQAADALVQGDVDVAFFIASPRAPIVQRLLTTRGIRLMSFERAEAYTRTHRSLSSVTLPQGVIDLQKNIPPDDTILLAATANLVVREDFHPALVDLFLQTATEIHGPGGLFEGQDEFPSPKYLEFPLSGEAQRFYKRGPSFLRRVLPFWAATFVDRTVVLLIPFLALLFPLFKIVPPAYRWRVRSKIYRWYKDVMDVDLALHDEHSVEGLNALMIEVDRIEQQVDKITTPLPYADQLYNLRMHINLVREKLGRAMKNDGANPS